MDTFDSRVIADFKRISLASYRRAKAAAAAQAAAAYNADTSGMSSDQKSVYDEEGSPDHIERYDAPGYHVVTWWYNSEDESSYRVGYTFTNGRLTSVYKP